MFEDERIIHVIWILAVVAILGYMFRYMVYGFFEWFVQLLKFLTPDFNFTFDY